MYKDKIGIITLYGLNNYGNRLQNYAVQQIFSQFGYDCETIVSAEFSLKRYLKFWVKSIIHNDIKAFKFNKFNRKFIKIRKLKDHSVLFSDNLASEYKYFVVGSDQVWNPDIRQNQRENFFLQFASREQRLTISPSMAVKQIDEKWEQCFKEGLLGFDYISVREESSATIIKKLTGQQAFVTIDPTMGLSAKAWKAIEKRIKSLPPKYIVVNFLGEILEIDKNFIDKISEQKELAIINLKYKPWNSIAPDEFIFLIRNATLVCTDSFHCTVFSILFHVPFVVFERKSLRTNDITSKGMDRLDTLLNTFGLSERVSSNIKNVDVLNCKFDNIDTILESKRKELFNFINLELGRQTSNEAESN